MKKNQFYGLKKVIAPALLAFFTLSCIGLADHEINGAAPAPPAQMVKTLLYHKVADFNKWKAVFDGAKDLRAQAGELNYELGTFQGQPDVAYVINDWVSADAFQSFMSKPELRDAMQQAGVLEPPHAFVFNSVEKTPMIGNKPTILIYHKVADFSAWKAVFDGAKGLRAQAGELSYEVGTLKNDPSVVYVFNEWTSVESFNAFMSNPNLAEAMKKGGVLEAPNILVFDKKAASSK